ncbi:MAG: HAD family hydrolase [Spirochaetia bacterium]|jgi:Cof subfamily protein (haloacid dehalogenase superfamily)|nr:HAD family hydrolase [Spirochaetia bacterium]
MLLNDKCRLKGIEAVVATDFDGTLLQSDHTVSDRSKDTLSKLGDMNILRVIVTGRSLYSLNKVLTDDVPIDYLIVASGAGIYCRESRQLIYNTGLSTEDTEQIGNKLLDLGCDFMVHFPLPDNHKFLYHKINNANSDYQKRYEIYEDYAAPLNQFSELTDGSSQFLVIDIPDGDLFNNLDSNLDRYTVIRTTSPLDHQSAWIEIFPLNTDKGKSLKILTENYNLGSDKVLSIGNDFNDVHMLRWADESRVVANAHKDLRAEFKNVSSNDNEGFSEAVEEWLKGRF